MDSWPTWIREGGLGGFKSWLLTTPTQPQSLLPNAGKDWDPLIPALEGTVSQTPPPQPFQLFYLYLEAAVGHLGS